MRFDHVLRGGKAVIASDVIACDAGIGGNRISALGDNLEAAARTVDVSGKWVLPGGIDSHCHIEQESSSGVWTTDDFHTATTIPKASCGRAAGQPSKQSPTGFRALSRGWRRCFRMG